MLILILLSPGFVSDSVCDLVRESNSHCSSVKLTDDNPDPYYGSVHADACVCTCIYTQVL